MLIRKLQNNFTAGVLSPAVSARTDLAKYASGCRRIVNGVVLAHGGIAFRNGTSFVGTLPGPGRLIPFTYSVTQAYVLAFYDPDPADSERHFAFMRICKDGGVVAVNGVPVSIETPYYTDELAEIKFAQSADTMFLVHRAHPPRKLVRYSHESWEFSKIVFRPSIEPPTGLSVSVTGMKHAKQTTTQGEVISTTVNAYVKDSISYKVAAVDSRSVESVPSEAVTTSDSGDNVVYRPWDAGAKVTLTWNPVDGADHYEVYKNSRGYYAWVGSVDECKFVDDNVEGEASTGPKENRDPFTPPDTPENVAVSASGTVSVRVSVINSDGVESVASEALEAASDATVTFARSDAADSYHVYFDLGSGWKYTSVKQSGSGSVSVNLSAVTDPETGSPLDAPNSYPGAVGIYQQRLVFGRSDGEPQTVWLTETGAFDSMAVASPLRSDSAITASVDSRQMNEIRHFVPLRNVLMLTSGAEFIISAGKNFDAVTPTTIQFDIQSYWGSSHVPPIVSGSSVLVVQNSGRTVRDLFYQISEEGYAGNELSILAEHLIDCPITDWAYQQSPYSTVWCCLESGKLLTLTYMREHEVWAWAEHESSGGKFLSVSSIREGTRDRLYFIVERDGQHFVEFQELREYSDPIEKAFFVDCGLSASFDTPVAQVSGLGHLAGKSVVALADGSVVRGLTVSASGIVKLPNAASVVTVGLPYEMMVETLDPEIRADNGSLAGEPVNVVKTTLFVRETRGLKVGPSEDELVTVKFPLPKHYNEAPPLFSGSVDLTLPGKHRTGASIVVKQTEPLPATLLALNSVISVG